MEKVTTASLTFIALHMDVLYITHTNKKMKQLFVQWVTTLTGVLYIKMNLQLKRLELEGFQSYKSPTILNFETGVTYIKGVVTTKPTTVSSNGAGKTTLLNALCWVLYGEVPSGVGAGEVINWDSNSCSVYVDLGYAQVWRTRNAKRSTVKFQEGTKNIEEGDARVMNSRIARFLKVSYKTFVASLYFTKTSKSVQFLKETPSVRAEILSEFVNVEPFRLAAGAVSGDLKVLNAKLSRNNTLMESAQAELTKVTNHIRALKGTIENHESEHRNRIAKLRDRVSQAKVELREQSLILQSEPDKALESLEKERIELGKRLREVDENLLGLHADLGFVRETLLVGEPCPLCLREVLEDTVLQRTSSIAGAQGELQKLNREKHEITQKTEAVRKQQLQLKEQQRLKWAAPKRISELKTQIHDAEDAMVPARALTDLKAELTTHLEDRRERSQVLSKLSDEVTEANARKGDLGLLLAGFSTEIRNLLFDQVRQSLSLHTNEYLKQLDGSIKVEYPSSSKTGKEKFDVLIYQDGNAQSLESLSEGEHWRTSFSILLALRRTLLASARCKLPVLFVDDPVGGLDKRGTEVFQRTLERIAEAEGMTILVTLPREELIPKAANVITVTKTERGSKAK